MIDKDGLESLPLPAIDDCRRHICDHHEEVRDGQVDDEEVARALEAARGSEDVDDGAVPEDGDQAGHGNRETHQAVHQRVDRWELIP